MKIKSKETIEGVTSRIRSSCCLLEDRFFDGFDVLTVKGNGSSYKVHLPNTPLWVFHPLVSALSSSRALLSCVMFTFGGRVDDSGL